MCGRFQEDGFERRPDAEILDRAKELGRVVFTQDVDFLPLTDRCLPEGKPFTDVCFANSWQLTIGQANRDLDQVCRVLSPAEMAQQRSRWPLSRVG